MGDPIIVYIYRSELVEYSYYSHNSPKQGG